jgi:hypothetical protein
MYDSMHKQYIRDASSVYPKQGGLRKEGEEAPRQEASIRGERQANQDVAAQARIKERVTARSYYTDTLQ